MPVRKKGRYTGSGKPADSELGPLKHLVGKWSNLPNLPGRGWNMIALPFAATPPNRLNYRLLMNQYNEDLVFDLVDKGVPNRGIKKTGATTKNTDQTLATIDYQQTISQIAAADSPASGLEGDPGAPIHHEPGLWLHMRNERTDGLDIARLGSIPHGDSVLALGKSKTSNGAPTIPDVNGLPIGVSQDLANNPYLAPYEHFNRNPFQNLFEPVNPSQLLDAANQGVNIRRTTELEVDTAIDPGGVINIPFIVKQANAADMKSTFWIQELAGSGKPRFRLQYLQVVILDFFPRRDGLPGLIRWPHVSINTLEKV